MPVHPVERKLAAIFAADIAGYSRLMARDEVGTLARLKACRAIIDGLIASHRGRIFNTAGDSVIADFASAVDAVQCAVAVQAAIATENASGTAGEPMLFRIGVHVGDVMVDGENLLGDGVNIAARLESLAEPGAICISAAARDHIGNRLLPLSFDDLGGQRVKNIDEAIRVYRVQVEKPAAQPAALPLPDKPSIAVLPFQNMSGDPEQEYFADGMVEEIITSLSRIRWLFVIARNSSFKYKGQAIDVKQVGRELGVRYVLEGSVRKSGDRVRITAQLINTTTGAHLWADRFDGSLEDVFKLQDEVAINVASVIEPKLQIAEAERARRKPTESLDAYDCFLRAMPLVWKMTAEANTEALNLSKRAIELDPNYASAYALAAQCFVFRRTMSWENSLDAGKEEGTRLARKAVELGGDDPNALWMAGQALAYLGKDFDGALAAIDRSLALNPSSSSAYMYSGWVYNYCNEPSKAIEQFRRALRLSPYDPAEWLIYAGIGRAYMKADQHEQAIAAAQRALQSNPYWAGTYRVLVMAYARLNRMDEARNAVQQLLAIDPGLTIAGTREIMAARDPEDLECQLDDFRKAGLPE